MSTAIKFENISKQYRLGLVSTNTISHDLNRWWKMNIQGKEDPYLKIGEVNDRAHKGNSDYVWALKDINFEVQQGDVLGIIGKNGAGKSTLLKILSKVTAPSTGTIKAAGRIASLLEVGTGFHPEMTGRENIYMNGAIMGMTKQEISRKLDEIVDFSGVERYIDTPTKRYSSGMTVRLGFAIAAHLEPEILVVDEVLAVGDAEFQKKAIGKMQDVSKGEGRTVLFVSHNLASLQSLCHNGVLLKDGMCVYSGNINEAISRYVHTFGDMQVQNSVIFNTKNERVAISRISICGISDSGNINETGKFYMNERLKLNISVSSKMYLDDIKSSVIIATDAGTNILAVRTFEMMNSKYSSSNDFELEAIFPDLNLMPGNYSITIGLANRDETIQIKQKCLGFTVVPYDIYNTGKIPGGDFLIYSKAQWNMLEK